MTSMSRSFGAFSPAVSWRPVLSKALGLIGLLLVAAVVGSAPTTAQERASLDVLVRTENELPLTGVTVVMRGSDVTSAPPVRTDLAGLARFESVAPGLVTVECSLDGFETAILKDVALQPGVRGRIQSLMRARMDERVIVVGTAPLVNLQRTDLSRTVVTPQVDGLPLPERDPQRLAFLAPAVSRERGTSRFIEGSPVVGAAGNASYTTFLADGMDLTDTRLGLSRVKFSADAISEFRVIAGAADVEVGGSAGSAISIVTRSGSNVLSGGVFAFQRHEALRARAAFELAKPDFSRAQAGGTLGGPLVRNRAHYFGSIERFDETGVALIRPAGAFSAQAADVPRPIGHTMIFAALRASLTLAQRVEVRAPLDRYQEENAFVGGTGDEGHGRDLERRNWNASASHNWMIGTGTLNTLRFQYGRRFNASTPYSSAPSEWFSSGNTLRTGSHEAGPLLNEGMVWELRNTWSHDVGGRGLGQLRAGASVSRVHDRLIMDVYEHGYLQYSGDDRRTPIFYMYADGSSDVTLRTWQITTFAQQELRPRTDVTIKAGFRYDLDTDGNNPGYTHPFVPASRPRDLDNLQPRFALTWNVGNRGSHVVRGSVGRFTARFPTGPSLRERQLNGVTGRVVRQRRNGVLFGRPDLPLDLANPRETGLPVPPSAFLLDRELDAPDSAQASAGYTMRIGRTGLYLDIEGLVARGWNEFFLRDWNWTGNATPVRPDPAWGAVRAVTNDGRSRYRALVASLTGTLPGGHLVSVSVTGSRKRTVTDDFDPEATFGYPSDSADIDAEYGRARSDEQVRAVGSGVWHLPWAITLGTVVEYGSGQPWNRRYGYDYNGDSALGDRVAGEARNDQPGPSFAQASVRLSKRIRVARTSIDAIVEVFNLFNTVNEDVQSLVDSGNGAHYLSGPTLQNPSRPYVANPNFGRYTDSLAPREIQLGLRWRF
jgi:hypothetical protein